MDFGSERPNLNDIKIVLPDLWTKEPSSLGGPALQKDISENAKKLIAAWSFAESATGGRHILKDKLRAGMEKFFGLPGEEFDTCFSEVLEFGVVERK